MDEVSPPSRSTAGARRGQPAQDGETRAGVDDGGDLAAQERLLRPLTAATFLIFFQAFMVAPLIPRLAQLFDSSVDTVGLSVPAYLIPYGAATLIWGPLSDRVDRMFVIRSSLAAFAILTVATAAPSRRPAGSSPPA